MKKKVKRYQEGGEAELKARGLESSKGDKVGFFERLRMGNIDDPSSEAYRRFGAGRAKMDIEAKTPVPESAKETSDYSGRGAKSYGDDGMNVPHSTVTKASQKTAADEDVTNESSYSPRSTYEPPDIGDATNDDIKPSKPKPKTKTKSATEVAREIGKGYMKAAESAKPAKKEPMYDLAKAGRALADTFSSERATKRYAESTPYARSKMGMKSGGKVSSASSRADGIAQRGKTRGRIC